MLFTTISCLLWMIYNLTLHVLSFYAMTPAFASSFWQIPFTPSPELFLSLEPGDIQLALVNLSSIVTYELSGAVEILHASLVDFLSDKRRSTIFYIDKARTCHDFVCRSLEYVKGPDGKEAGHTHLFNTTILLLPQIPGGRLRSEILNFDLDAFITASIRWLHKDHHFPLPISGSMLSTFDIWKRFLDVAGLEGRDKKGVLNRLNKSLQSRLQIYQSDWRLKLLLTLAVTNTMYNRHPGIPSCRCLDILLEMDDHDLHLADQNALDLRHQYFESSLWNIIPNVNNDACVSAALHCMRFLSNPPKYSKRNTRPEMGVIYVEWQETCAMTLGMLCKLLQRAKASPELVQFLSNNDIHPRVPQNLYLKFIWSEVPVNIHILAFLSRAGVCPNWRIISEIQRSPLITRNQQASRSDEDKWDSYKVKPDGRATRDLILRNRLDQCCLDGH